jgi:hypothetical protein
MAPIGSGARMRQLPGRRREPAHKKAKLLAISHLTEQIHTPIYAAHAAGETRSCGRRCFSGKMKIRAKFGSLTL